jgi:hypothetical protein
LFTIRLSPEKEKAKDMNNKTNDLYTQNLLFSIRFFSHCVSINTLPFVFGSGSSVFGPVYFLQLSAKRTYRTILSPL